MALNNMKYTANLFRRDKYVTIYVAPHALGSPFVIPKSRLHAASPHLLKTLADSGSTVAGENIFAHPKDDELGWMVFAAWLHGQNVPLLDFKQDTPAEYFNALAQGYVISKKYRVNDFTDDLIRAFSTSSMKCDVPLCAAKKVLELTKAGDSLRKLVIHRVVVAAVRYEDWKQYAFIGQHEDAFVQFQEESRMMLRNRDDTPASSSPLHDLDPSSSFTLS